MARLRMKTYRMVSDGLRSGCGEAKSCVLKLNPGMGELGGMATLNVKLKSGDPAPMKSACSLGIPGKNRFSL